MKKAAYFLLASILSVSAAYGQSRTFDNFDTPRGVTVQRSQTLSTPPAAALDKKGRPRSQKTVAQLDASKNGRIPVGSRVSVNQAESPKSYVKPTGSVKAVNQPKQASSVAYIPIKTIMAAPSGMRGFTTGDVIIDSYIVSASAKHGIDPLLIYSQMHQESSFKIKATSYKGASGLMQLMPATARRLGVTNIYDPKQNIEGGVKYMRILLDMFGGDVSLALAGYNAGEGAVMKYGNTIPPYSETREYVRRIMGRYSTISNPQSVRTVKKVSNGEAERLAEKASRPLAVYEPNPVAVRLADGRMRLVNQ